jgi:hypothetical protein
MINNLTAFYGSHYNFGIIAAFILLLAIILATKRNIRGTLVVLAIFLVYNVVLNKKYLKNPDWYEEGVEKVENTDVVGGLWSADKAQNMKKKSEERLQGQ